MINILRLDYSKPPPGWDVAGPWPAGLIVAAWKDYKREHDPPGMWTTRSSEVTEAYGDQTWEAGPAELLNGTGPTWIGQYGSRPEARAAAWAWYDRRDNIADALVIFTMPSSASVRSPFWPRCLTWTDEQVAEVERWLWDSSAKMPAVLDTDDGNTDD